MLPQGLKIIVAEDEHLSLQKIVLLLEQNLNNSSIVAVTNGTDAQKAFQTHERFDLAFLDVDMPGLNGIEVIQRLDKNTRPRKVIFVTAHANFAAQAFNLDVSDYLVKPYTRQRFFHCLRKVTSEVHVLPLPTVILEHPKLKVSIGRRVELIDSEQVFCFRARQKMTWALMNSGEYLLDSSLLQLEKILNLNTFFRAHRNALVNVNFVASFVSAEPSSLLLQNGVQIDVSRDFRRNVRLALEKYPF